MEMSACIWVVRHRISPVFSVGFTSMSLGSLEWHREGPKHEQISQKGVSAIHTSDVQKACPEVSSLRRRVSPPTVSHG